MSLVQSEEKLYVHLEFARGLAALLVLASHLRAFIFVDYAQVINPGILDKVFYFLAGLGHQAVMVFFVLSGFLITKSIEKMVAEGRWSWILYLVNRLSRLWTVLVPALFLTFFWDSLGKALSGSQYYLGSLSEMYNSGPLPDDQLSNYSFFTFIQNIFFLQTITTSSYGTNGPLWSLAYEFWYYIIFPLGYTLSISKKKIFSSLIVLSILLLIVLYIPDKILLGGVIWLIGYFVGLLEMNKNMHMLYNNIFFLFMTLFLFGLSLVATRAGYVSGFFGEFVVGLSFGLLMLSLIYTEARNVLYVRVSDFISNISYTLYLVHFPLLGFICSVFVSNQQFQPVDGVGLYVALFIFIMFYAYLIFWMFEKNTPVIRKLMWRFVNRRNVV